MKKIFGYIGITFGMTWLVWGIMALVGVKLGESAVAQGIVALTMWFPALGYLILKRLFKGKVSLGTSLKPRLRGHAKIYFLAWFIPLVFTLAGACLYYLVFPAQFDPLAMYAPAADGSVMSTGVIAAVLALSIVAAPIFNTLFGLGEEIGWRGFLYPAMRAQMSERKAVVLGGIVWGLWHAPITAMGHNYGTQYWGYPWTGILAMCLFCVPLGILFSWMTTKSESVWPAALSHGALNAMAGLPLLFLSAPFDAYRPLGPALSGALAGVPMLVCALVVLARAYKKRV